VHWLPSVHLTRYNVEEYPFKTNLKKTLIKQTKEFTKITQFRFKLPAIAVVGDALE
jgi:hypothetical protein